VSVFKRCSSFWRWKTISRASSLAERLRRSASTVRAAKSGAGILKEMILVVFIMEMMG